MFIERWWKVVKWQAIRTQNKTVFTSLCIVYSASGTSCSVTNGYCTYKGIEYESNFVEHTSRCGSNDDRYKCYEFCSIIWYLLLWFGYSPSRDE